MTSVFKKSVAPLAVMAALGAGAAISGPAAAADLGGDCCADLEERIAELEATAARKGNRKVSLTVSGWVNEMVMFWDDGTESNTYVGTNGLEQSRVKFSGKAKIDKDWSAGYTIELGVKGGDSGAFAQDDTGSANSISVRKSYWYLKSESLGQVSVGQNGTSTYHLLDDVNGFSNLRNYSDAEAAAVALGSFELRDNNGNTVGGLLWKDALRGFNNSTPGQSGRRNVVRYDTPEFAGFSASASWGEDDMWDTSLSYVNKALGDFGVAAQVGYGESSDPGATKCGSNALKCTWWGAAGTIIHNPTGLFVYGGYGSQELEDLPVAVSEATSDFWIIQGGIVQKWMPLGKTTIFGEFRHDDAGSNLGKTESADIDYWAAGVVQNIDAAAMDVYLIYRNASGDVVEDGAATATKLDDFDLIQLGARIQF